MKHYIGSEKIRKPFANACVALGNFDGVHLGHQLLIKKACELARQYNGTSVAYTFDTHPAKILAPEGAPSLLQTLNQKLEAIAKLGVDVCVVEKFTKRKEEPPYPYTMVESWINMEKTWFQEKQWKQ